MFRGELGDNATVLGPGCGRVEWGEVVGVGVGVRGEGVGSDGVRAMVECVQCMGRGAVLVVVREGAVVVPTGGGAVVAEVGWGDVRGARGENGPRVRWGEAMGAAQEDWEGVVVLGGCGIGIVCDSDDEGTSLEGACDCCEWCAASGCADVWVFAVGCAAWWCC